MIQKRVVRSFLNTSFTSALRMLSTKPGDITKAQLEENLQKVEKYRKYIASTAKPKTISNVMVGREKEPAPSPEELAALSGMPEVHQERTVVIQSRPQSAQSHGDRTSNQWQIVWKKSDGWTNKITGWTSGADPMVSVRLGFDSSEEAIEYAKKNGWKYEVKQQFHDETAELGWRVYDDNFLPERVSLTVKAEGGIKSKYFNNPKYGESHFVMPLKYHGDGEVIQHG